MSAVVPHINTVIVAGRCTHDPDIKYSEGGMACVDWQLGTKTARHQDGHVVWRDSYVQVASLGANAEFVGRHLRRGTPVVVQGQLHEVTWRGAGGRLMRRVKVLADGIHLLDMDSDSVSDTDTAEPGAEGATEPVAASTPGADSSPDDPPGSPTE